MDRLRPIDRTHRGPDSRPSHAPALWRAVCLAGLCIAVFEGSQLVFRQAARPGWIDASELVARVEARATQPGVMSVVHPTRETGDV